MLDRYEIRGKIGQGGLGMVYAAYDKNLGREVAIKRVLPDNGEDPEYVAKTLVKEAGVMASINHPNIITVYDVGEDEEGPFVVMELLKGETLDDTITRGALPIEDFTQVVVQSLEALVAAQDMNLLHRDLKPANIMVVWLASGKFQVKILDFGLAKFSQQPSVQTIDHGDAILGSIFFMAPEQFERAPLDVRTDLYSMGAIYYYTLTAQYPFQGENAPQVMASHLQHRFTPLKELRPDLPDQIVQWVEWLMNRQMDDRPTNAREALEVFRSGALVDMMELSGRIPVAGTDSGVLTGRVTANASSSSSTGTVPLLKTKEKPKTRPLVTQGDVDGVSSGPITGSMSGKISPASAKAGMPAWAKITIPALLLLGGGIGGKVWWDGKVKTEQAEQIAALAAEDNPEPSAEMVPILFESFDDPSQTAGVSQIFSKSESIPNLEPTLLEQLPKFSSKPARINAVKILGIKGYQPAFDRLLELTSSPDKDLKNAAWVAIGSVAPTTSVKSLIDRLPEVSKEERKFCEGAIVEVCKQISDENKRTAPLVEAINRFTDKEAKVSLLKIFGRLGSFSAYQQISKFLGVPDKEMRLAAASALGSWPNTQPLSRLVQHAKAEKDDSIRIATLKSLTNLAPLPGALSQAQVRTQLEDAIKAAKRLHEKQRLYQAIGVLVEPSVKTFLDALKKDPTQAKLAAQLLAGHAKIMSKLIKVESNAKLNGDKINLFGNGAEAANGMVTNWQMGTIVGWDVEITKPGNYRVEITTSYKGSNTGKYAVLVGNAIIERPVTSTGGDLSFQNQEIGAVKFDTPGVYRVWIKPVQVPGEYLMNLQSLELKLLSQ